MEDVKKMTSLISCKPDRWFKNVQKCSYIMKWAVACCELKEGGQRAGKVFKKKSTERKIYFISLHCHTVSVTLPVFPALIILLNHHSVNNPEVTCT